ncbi:MAG: protein kinase [Acidobacteriota bacterium]
MPADAPNATADRPELIHSLITRLLITCVGLTALAVLAAVLITEFIGRHMADQAVRDALERAGSVQISLEEERLQRLSLSANLFVNDPYFSAYVAEAATSGDTLSILDQLDERQRDLGFDMAMVLDPDGQVLVRTDRPTIDGSEDLSSDPLIAQALENYEAYGIWRTDQGLYEAVVVPLGTGGTLLVFLVTAYQFDEARAQAMSIVQGTDIAIFDRAAGEPVLATSTLRPQDAGQLTEALQRQPELFDSVEPCEITFANRRWLASILPLENAQGTAVGSALSLASYDQQLAPFRRLGTLLLWVGVAVVLLVSGLMYWLLRRLLSPLPSLAATATAAARGHYDVELGHKAKRDEIGMVSRAIDHLLAELREKRDMEDYMRDLASHLPEAPALSASTVLPSSVLPSSVLPSSVVSPGTGLAGVPGAPTGVASAPTGIAPGAGGEAPTVVFSNPTASTSVGTAAQPSVAAATGAPVTGQTATATSTGGALFGSRFELRAVLGAGGMGMVYLAHDRDLDEAVALKMLKEEAQVDAENFARLKRELKLARKIAHPNVLRTYDFGEVNGLPFITMEYVRGIDLRKLLERRGALPWNAGLRLARQLCRGLDAAHQQGVLHRDIKPENIIVDATGNAKLMDFGIARPIQRMAGDVGHTRPGSVVGTPFYLAPEQLKGEEPDARADIYACGVVFYELFTGVQPFGDETNIIKLLTRKAQEDPAPPRQFVGDLPAPLDALIMRCLQREPAGRYASAQMLQEALDAIRV